MNCKQKSIDWLLLVPTAMEARVLNLVDLSRLFPDLQFDLQLCGFGLISAAASTASFLQAFQPRRVLLVGIAGAYHEPTSVGSAVSFGAVGCHGIGVGEGSDFRTAYSLGFPQTSAVPAAGISEETIPLHGGSPEDLFLLSVCSAAGTQEDCRRRLEVFPQAFAEDMEGFGVGLACQTNGTPLTIVRGISNLAGDRDKANWRIETALNAAREQVEQILANLYPARTQ